MSHKTRLFSLLIVVLFVGFVFGLAAEEPKYGGELIAGISADPVGFDPHKTSAYSSFEVLENVYNTLVTVGDDLTPQPAIAKSWEVSEDGLTWTFHIREGIKFHNGRTLVAGDIEYSLERIMDPDTGSGAAWRLATVENISAPDDDTVVIALQNPYPGLLTKVGGYKGMAIVAKENVESGKINTRPVGTGPFEFVEHVPGDRVVLSKNEEYWEEELPYLDGINFRVIPDETVRKTSLLTGEVHWIDSVPSQEIEQLKKRDNVVLGESSGTAYWYAAFNLDHEPFGDRRVRKAIAMSINRSEIAAAAKWDAAVANDSPVPEASYWSTDYHPYLGEQNYDKAEQLLTEAGYPNGFNAGVMVSTQYPGTVRAAQVMQAQVARIGVNLKIRTLEWGTWLEEQSAGNFDIYINGWIDNLDPDDYFYAQHYTGEVFNFTGYSNEELDELLDEGRMEPVKEKRYELYSEIEKTLIDDAPYVYIYIPKVVHAWRPIVKGYTTRPDEALKFKATWIAS
ncbi:MAG: ABC transporter substrate-binding protein [Candidatus Acetothermia bacterium]